jgi:hypothetical protein
LVASAIGVASGFAIRDGLKTGQIYSMSIIFDIKKMIYENTSPTEYWVTIGVYGLSFLGGIGLGILSAIGNIKEYKRKLNSTR